MKETADLFIGLFFKSWETEAADSAVFSDFFEENWKPFVDKNEKLSPAFKDILKEGIKEVLEDYEDVCKKLQDYIKKAA